MRKNHGNPGIHAPQGSHRALSALISLSLAVTLGVGCSGEGITEEAQSSDAAENALIQSHLEGRGYDTSTLQFEGEKVIVEHDMVMSRALLLAQAEAAATGLVEKGYFKGTTRFSGKRIALSFASNVSAAWRTALTTARNDWNNNTPMFARDPGSAATISVVMGTDFEDTVARGDFPPDRTITLNADYSGDCGANIEAVPAATKRNIALHEMGHVLGFEHPPPAAGTLSRVHITGTATTAGTSVMRSGCFTTTLSADDILSAGKKYPSCIATCEHNCTFNVDPGQIGLCMSACPGQCGG
jgi:hypothetical protein